MSLRIRSRRRGSKNPEHLWKKFLSFLETLSRSEHECLPPGKFTKQKEYPQVLQKIALKILQVSPNCEMYYKGKHFYESRIGGIAYPILQAASSRDGWGYSLLHSGQIIWTSSNCNCWDQFLAPKMNEELRRAITKGIWPNVASH